ncbi:MAG: asparagine synthase (glutamine-hydrolyzing) [Betaproteobacteria bacterium]|nr:asparagine synthase (glutamine-hydrolyzing) [Betaproteobacteria bacterium]MDH5350206.1 asparagine synthase (glutamine-hydrolyzing) [Betaproteobacteria bacterium]
MGIAIMCGIAGIVSPTPLEEQQLVALRRMNRAMTRRGPDDEGYFIGTRVALAMRRLSIIDIVGGHQPIQDKDQDLVIVCNGEIYNYLELRAGLGGNDYAFRTNSDVETILPLYRAKGLRCLEDMRGMFAFALWDARDERLILARDRFGEKPLYLHRDAAGRLWFASEMKALLAGIGGGDSLALSPEAVHLFMIYQFIPEPGTMFAGVSKLPAGHVMEISPGQLASTSGMPASHPYWTYANAPSRAGNAAALVRESIEDAVRLTLRSDVPVGISLSGGIDSSIIAALCRKFHSGEMKAFSVGYPGRPASDERLHAEAFAKRLDMPFFDIELSTDGFASSFPQIVHDMDDPIGDIAAYGYHAVARLAREHDVPVLLSGLGADELFWGYPWVRDAVKASIAKRAAGPRGLFKRLLDRNPRRAVFYDSLPWMRAAVPSTKKLMTPAASEAVSGNLWTSYFEADDWGCVPIWLLDVLNRTWLTSNCLALADRVSMAHSVESRLPFLDSNLADLVTGLRRGGLKDWESGHKRLLTDAVRDLLPAEILNRIKRGFTPPFEEWMGAIQDRYGPLLENGSLVNRGIFRDNVARMMQQRNPAGFAYRATLLEVWMRLFVEGQEVSDLARRADAHAHS